MPNSSLKLQVLLLPEVRAELEAVARKTSAGVATVRRAKILLMADEAHSEGGCPDWEIAEEVGLSERQVVRIRQKFVKSGMAPTLARATRCDAGISRALDGRAEAELVVIACSSPPEGRDHWTLQMLCDELQRQRIVKSICCETVRQALKKTNYAPGLRSGSASPKPTGPGSSRGWRKSSTSTRKHSTSNTR
jgi:hypothetical protein